MKLTSHLYDNTKGTTMLTQLLWYLVKCCGFFSSIRYPIDEFFLRQYYFGNTIFFSLLAVKAFVLVNNSTLRSNKPPYCFELNHISRGGGTGGPNLPPPVPCNPGSRPFFLGFLPFALFRLRNIMQCCVIFPYLCRFPPFWNSHLPPFPLPPPVPLPPPILPGSRPPCPPSQAV